MGVSPREHLQSLGRGNEGTAALCEEKKWGRDGFAGMKKENNEFLGLLCNLYLVALLVALPLYTGEGYWSLGNTKYALFRNVSLLCLGIWLAAGLSIRIWAAAKRVGRRAGKKGSGRLKLGMVDWAVAAYGICVLLSALCSDYVSLAWTGYEGWYMGAVSQLLFVGIYFFVSRRYDGARWPLYLGEAALFLVTLFGLLHRLGIDPLRLLIYWNYQNWEYSHMLSTLGNINWLCGYYSVALAFGVVHFLREGRLWLKLLLYVGNVAAFVLLGVQGSQGGLLVLAVCVAVCAWLGRRDRAALTKLWALLAGFFLCMPLMGLGMKLRGNKAAVVADGNVFAKVEWYVWIMAGAVCIGACLWLVKKGPALGDWIHHRPVKIVFFSGVAVCLAAALFVLSRHGIDDSFGNGRGFLWRIALEGFGEADARTKLLGAGPDCYGVAVFGRLGAGTDVWKGEHWEGAVYTNAHNEFLSQLCNVGILGTVSYLAIFLAGLWRYGQGCGWGRSQGVGDSQSIAQGQGGRWRPVQSVGDSRIGRRSGRRNYVQSRSPGDATRLFGLETYDLWTGLLAIAMYGAHSLISFQQVLNAPLLFLVLGICENRIRRGGELRGQSEDADSEEMS